MTDADKADFLEGFRVLAAAFQRDLTDPQVAESYFLALSDLPLAALVDGMVRAMREVTFFPPPVVLRRLAGHEYVAAVGARVPGRLAADTPRLSDLRRYGTALATRTAAVIERRLARQLDHAGYLAALADLEQEFPGIGFAEVARRLDVTIAQDRESRAIWRHFHPLGQGPGQDQDMGIPMSSEPPKPAGEGES
jgi:hypothetical protein